MKIFLIKMVVALITVLFICACSPRFYRPPALGAEYQVDRGLPPEKNPSSLFGKKMEKDLTRKGVLRGSSKKKTVISKPASTKNAETDSTHTDSLRTDSMRISQERTLLDSTAHPTVSPAERKE